MDINDLREKRKKLAADIASSVSVLVEAFKAETGFSPHRINIDMVSVREMGDLEPQFMVGRCDVDIDI